MSLDALVKEAQGLPEKAIPDVIRYMKFLKFEASSFDDLNAPATPPRGKIRKAGIWKGQIKMAEDFDAPLDDFKEYM